MPIVTIQSPTGQSFQIEAPSGATDEQVLRFAKSQGLFDQQPQEEVATTQPITQTENIPRQPITAESLAPQQLHNQVIGGLEGALQLGTGVLGEIAGGLTATVDLLNPLTSNDPVQVLNNVKEILTYEPRGVNEDAAIQQLAEKLEPMKPIIESVDAFTSRAADKGVDLTGSPAVGAFIKTIPTMVGEMLGVGALTKAKPILPKMAFTNPKDARLAIAENILSGTPDTNTVANIINSSGELVTNKTAKRALKVLEKDLGGDSGIALVSVMESTSPATKSRVNKMLDIVDKGRRNPLFKDEHRASDVLGDAVADRARAIAKINKQAGEKIGATAKSLNKTNVDLSTPIDGFIDKLSNMGVTFTRGDDGWVTPDFSRSKFMGGSQKDMTVLVNDLVNKTPDFESAHNLKQLIRDNVNFDSIGPSKIKGDSERALKDLATQIDDVLDSTSDTYKKANERFAKTVGVKDAFDKMAGKDIDIFDPDAAKSLGDKARRLVSNATSRTQINKVIRDAESVLEEFNIRFKDDIPAMNHIVTKIEDSFKITREGSLKGNLQDAAVNVATGLDPTLAGLEAVRGKVKNLSAPDFNKKMRAYRSLTNQGKR